MVSTMVTGTLPTTLGATAVVARATATEKEQVEEARKEKEATEEKGGEEGKAEEELEFRDPTQICRDTGRLH